MTFKEHIDKIVNKEMYSFSRWGDGEWLCLLGAKGMNCDKHQYFPELREALRRVLESSPKYILGLQNHAKKSMGNAIDDTTSLFNLEWVASDIFHNASINGELPLLIDALKGRNVVLVGAKHLKGFNGWEFIEVPSVDCWLNYEETLKELEQTITKDDVVLFCASMMSNVLIDKLNGKATLIDVGSVFDPYVGVKSRTYHKTLKV
jgi:hypothetical protein